jgi:ribulose-phosphate 3-epimerase
MDIIPAVLEKTEEDFIRKVSLLPAEAELIHIDVLEDDVWAPIERQFEAHLMVDEPSKIFGRWKERGAKRIIVHKYDESMHGLEVGFGIEMHISIESVLPEMRKADFIHLMSIERIGSQGHPLDERIFDRIRQVREMFPGKILSVDGGINKENCENLIEAGADRLVIGSKFEEVWTSQMKR